MTDEGKIWFDTERNGGTFVVRTTAGVETLHEWADRMGYID